MNKRLIKQAIIDRVEASKTVNYSSWTIGLTHDPKERMQEHQTNGKSVKRWKAWPASSLMDAQEIEFYFIIEKGMSGGTRVGARDNFSTYRIIYVFIF